MGRKENIEVFLDTQRMCEAEWALSDAIKDSDRMQDVILEQDYIPMIPPKFADPAEIVVSPKRTFEAARGYLLNHTCVLNFASPTNPGGGVRRGANAQEECLCRCSTLWFNLSELSAWKRFYEPHRHQNNPLNNDDCIYTPGVIVFKTDTEIPEPLRINDWWQTDVITCAAPDLRIGKDGQRQISISHEELKQIYVKRMRRILSIAAVKENDVLILGAFGCGAFGNPPEIVAEAIKQVINEFRYHFRVIEFAVYCTEKDKHNYRIFHRVIADNLIRIAEKNKGDENNDIRDVRYPRKYASL